MQGTETRIDRQEATSVHRLVAGIQPGQRQGKSKRQKENTGQRRDFVNALGIRKEITALEVLKNFDDIETEEQAHFLQSLYNCCRKLPNWKDITWNHEASYTEMVEYLWGCIETVNGMSAGAQIVYAKQRANGTGKLDEKPHFYAIIDHPKIAALAIFADCWILPEVAKKEPKLFKIIATTLALLNKHNDMGLWDRMVDQGYDSVWQESQEAGEYTEAEDTPQPDAEAYDDLRQEYNDILAYWSDGHVRGDYPAGEPAIYLKLVRSLNKTPISKLEKMIRLYRGKPYMKKWMVLALELIKTKKSIYNYDHEKPDEDCISPAGLYFFRWFGQQYEDGAGDRLELYTDSFLQLEHDEGNFTTFRMCRRIDKTEDPFTWPKEEIIPKKFEQMMLTASDSFYQLEKAYHGDLKRNRIKIQAQRRIDYLSKPTCRRQDIALRRVRRN